MENSSKVAVVLFILFTVGILALGFYVYHLQITCFENNYSQLVSISFEHYCMGIRDGNTVIVPVKSLLGSQ